MKTISIRAGLIYNIYNEKLTNKSLCEIIYFSKLDDMIYKFDILQNVLSILKKNCEELLVPSNDNLDIFGELSDYATNFLLDKIDINVENIKSDFIENITVVGIDSVLNLVNSNKSKNSIERDFDVLDNISDYDFEPSIIETCDYKNFINYVEIQNLKLTKINNAIKLHKMNMQLEKPLNLIKLKYNYNTRGHKRERSIISYLTKLGFVIEQNTSIYKKLTDSITLAGKPDGYIVESPISIYKNIYIEIKNKKYKNMSQQEELQLYTYYKLTKSSILLINIWKTDINFRLYTKEELKLGWKSIKDKIIENTNRIKNLIYIDNYEKYLRLKKLLSQDIILF